MPRLVTAPLFLVVATLALAACGGDDGSSDAGPASPKKATKATEPKQAADEGAGDPAADASAQGDGPAAKRRLKEWVNAIESCAANNTDGSYTGCNTVPRLIAFERPLEAIKDGIKVTPGADPMAYAVSLTTPGGTTFSESHAADGSIKKSCQPTGQDGCTGSW